MITIGQYYTIINIDKKEYIDPSDFDESVNLLGFALNDPNKNTLGALAVLLADGNGRGNGDLYHNTCDEGRIDLNRNPHLRVDGTYKSGRKTCKLIVPKIAGSWKGHRIVIGGDYADQGTFIPEDRPLNKKEKEYVENQYTSPDKYTQTTHLNLRDWAHIHFTNISRDVIKGLTLDQDWKTELKAQGLLKRSRTR